MTLNIMSLKPRTVKNGPLKTRPSSIPWTGLANASPEIKELAKPRIGSGQLPFDPLEYVEHLDELPFDRALDPSLNN